MEGSKQPATVSQQREQRTDERDGPEGRDDTGFRMMQ